MNEQIPLVIVLQQPPAGVDFGLQKGSGNSYETVQKQRSVSGDLYFEFTVTLKRNKDSVDTDFKGPFVQGPLKGRFVYIDIGTLAGQTDSAWSRRLKQNEPCARGDHDRLGPALRAEFAEDGIDMKLNCMFTNG